MKYIVLKNLLGQYYTTDFSYNTENEAIACCALMNAGHQSSSYKYVVAIVKED